MFKYGYILCYYCGCTQFTGCGGGAEGRGGGMVEGGGGWLGEGLPLFWTKQAGQHARTYD